MHNPLILPNTPVSDLYDSLHLRYSDALSSTMPFPLYTSKQKGRISKHKVCDDHQP